MQTFTEVKEVMAEFKSKYNLSKVGAQGFCWGGKYTVLLLGEHSPPLKNYLAGLCTVHRHLVRSCPWVRCMGRDRLTYLCSAAPLAKHSGCTPLEP